MKMNFKISVLLITILVLAIIPATSGGVLSPSSIQNSRISYSFPSYDKPPGISQHFAYTMGDVKIDVTKPALRLVLPISPSPTCLPMGVSLDKLHRNINLGLQKLSLEPDACWIPINPIGPIRIPMSVAYIDGYYCDTPWIPHISLPG